MLPLMKYITVHSVRQMLHSAMLPARAHYLYTDASPSGTPSRLNIVKTAVGVHDKILKMCLDKGDHYKKNRRGNLITEILTPGALFSNKSIINRKIMQR